MTCECINDLARIEGPVLSSFVTKTPDCDP